jgi:hypothetical protein
VTELCSGQALGDADNDADNDTDNDADTDAAADTADKSNPYMSPFQGDTIKQPKTAKINPLPTRGKVLKRR